METTHFEKMGEYGQAKGHQGRNAIGLVSTLAIQPPAMGSTRQSQTKARGVPPVDRRAQIALEGLIQELSLNEQRNATVDENGIRMGCRPDARYKPRASARDVLEGALRVAHKLTLVPGTRAYAGGNDLRLPWAVFGLTIDPQADGSVELRIAWR